MHNNVECFSLIKLTPRAPAPLGCSPERYPVRDPLDDITIFWVTGLKMLREVVFLLAVKQNEKFNYLLNVSINVLIILKNKFNLINITIYREIFTFVIFSPLSPGANLNLGKLQCLNSSLFQHNLV